jgi:hypothetical protein
MPLEADLVALESELATAKESSSGQITDIRSTLGKANAAIGKLAEAWSGSDIGYHSRLYHESLERPPLHRSFDVEWGGLHGLDGWAELSADDVQRLIEETVATTVDQLDQASLSVVAQADAARQEVLVVTAPLADAPGFERETNLITEIEQYAWEPQQRSPTRGGYRVTRDSRAMAEGIKVPPHRVIAYRLARVEGRIDACDAFFQLALRTVRQSLQRLRAEGEVGAEAQPLDELSLVLGLVRRFHLIARALRDRPRNRTALTMDDEYDVQYLLGGLLRLHFDDVRPEEWSPSYAGGASRLDFLLKREQIVVEVKRTRTGLTDRQVGEELIIDAARYAEHPDCKILVCLIHDPDQLIANPRGLEDDLGRLAHDDLQVAVVVN